MIKEIGVCFSCAMIVTALAFGTVRADLSHKGLGKEVQNADSISHFWDQFKAAVIKGDKQTVASLSRFPISRGYGMRSLKSKAQFMKRYRELFFAETNAAQCFPKAKPLVEKERPGEFTISCSFARDGGNEEPFVYTFTRTRTGWKFTSFENINE